MTEADILREDARVAMAVRDDARAASARDLELRREAQAERDEVINAVIAGPYVGGRYGMTVQRVSSCTSCPYAMDDSGGPQWTCHAEYNEQGWPMALLPPNGGPPPISCPLRKAARLVVLEVDR